MKLTDNEIRKLIDTRCYDFAELLHDIYSKNECPSKHGTEIAEQLYYIGSGLVDLANVIVEYVSCKDVSIDQSSKFTVSPEAKDYFEKNYNYKYDRT